MRIGFLSTRIAGTDGVSLEIHKWAEILRRENHQVYYCAGELDQGLPGEKIPEMHFTHPEAAWINSHAFNITKLNKDLENRIRKLAEFIYNKIQQFVETFKIDLLIVENALAIPMHISLGLAITKYIEDTGYPVLAHHHDFYWERERFQNCAVPHILSRCFPPKLPSIHHVVINKLARQSLLDRLEIPSIVFPNIFNYSLASPGINRYNSDLRASLKISNQDLLILQPTRIIRRKGIELAIELLAQIDQTIDKQKMLGKRTQLLLSHPAGDEGKDYLFELQQLAKAKKVVMNYSAKCFTSQPQAAPSGTNYLLWDAYIHSDFVTYPSLYEGFGNAFLEAIYFRLPLLVNRYPVYKSDIAPLGFDTIEIEGKITSPVVHNVVDVLMDPVRRRYMVEINYQIARDNFSYEAVTPLLNDLIVGCMSQ